MQLVDFSNPRFWLDLCQVIAMIVFALVLFARRPGEEAAKAITALAERVVIIEQRINNTPTAEELTQLSGGIKVIEAQGEAMAERMNAITHQLGLIQTYLLNNKR